MAIKRFTATADTTITNAFLEGLTTRATGSNIGLSDSLEVFSVYGQSSGSLNGFTSELSRVLVKFPITTSDDSVNSIQAKRAAGKIPASGSVSFYFRLHNVAHHETLPTSAKYNIFAASSSWEEGRGIDLDTYTDKTLDGVGANWINASSGTAWGKAGGDYHTGSTTATAADTEFMYSQTLANGDEDIEVDISGLVEQWIDGTWNNYGLGIFLTSSQEAYFSSSTGDDLTAANGAALHNLDGATTSYHTKKFSARGSEYFFNRPTIEARWNSATKDERGTLYYSSSLATGEENLQTLYFYNYFRGKLRNIPGIGTDTIRVSLFSGSSADTAPSGSALQLVVDGAAVTHANRNTVITGSYVSTGIYSASFALTAAATPLKTIYDVWFSGSDSVTDATTATQYHTGTIKPKTLSGFAIAPDTRYVTNIKNLRNVYRNDETSRFRLYTRHKNWSPTIYTKAVASPEVNIIESGSYEVYRVVDDLRVISYGTGSDLYTQMSFDASGSYFDLDMSMFESGYMYGIRISHYNADAGSWVEQPETFKFRVED